MLIMKNFSFLRHSIKCIIRNVVCIMHGKTFDIFHVYMDEIEWVRIKAAIARCGSKMWNKKSRFARTQHELMNRQIRNVVADIVHFSCMVAYLPVQQLILRIIFLCSTYLRHISLSSLLFPPTRLSMRFTFTFHSVFFFVSLHFWLRCMASRVLESIFPSIHSSICSFDCSFFKSHSLSPRFLKVKPHQPLAGLLPVFVWLLCTTDTHTHTNVEI